MASLYLKLTGLLELLGFVPPRSENTAVGCGKVAGQQVMDGDGDGAWVAGWALVRLVRSEQSKFDVRALWVQRRFGSGLQGNVHLWIRPRWHDAIGKRFEGVVEPYGGGFNIGLCHGKTMACRDASFDHGVDKRVLEVVDVPHRCVHVTGLAGGLMKSAVGV